MVSLVASSSTKQPPPMFSQARSNVRPPLQPSGWPLHTVLLHTQTRLYSVICTSTNVLLESHSALYLTLSAESCRYCNPNSTQTLACMVRALHLRQAIYCDWLVVLVPCPSFTGARTAFTVSKIANTAQPGGGGSSTGRGGFIPSHSRGRCPIRAFCQLTAARH